MTSSRIMLALDYVDYFELMPHIEQHLGKVHGFKFGSGLLQNPSALRHTLCMLERSGRPTTIMVDLKFKDTPETVAEHIKKFNCATYITIDCDNTDAAMTAAVEAAGSAQIVGVTLLSTFSWWECVRHYWCTPRYKALRNAQKAFRNGVRAFVCSGYEVAYLRKRLAHRTNEKLTFFVVGVRPVWSQTNTHKRAVTPEDACAKGADFVILGRPIVWAANPAAARDHLNHSIEERLCR